MELELNQYRMELFRKTMNKDEFDYLYNHNIVKGGHFYLERKSETVYLCAKIKKTEYRSFGADAGDTLYKHLYAMFNDLYNKLEKENKEW